jgi:SOS response regulatory protein OraA/RecX
MAQNNQEEIDLFFVLDKLSKAYHRFLASVYKGIQFVVKHWIVLLILIVGGYFGGQFWQRSLKSTREATLIVQNNFDSSSYVYSAVELLNVKYKQGDKAFLKTHNFNVDDPDLEDIIIEPIVNIMDLLEKQEASDRNLDTYLGKADFEEDLLLSEVFYPEYTYHRITVSTVKNNLETIEKVLTYLNSNKIYNKTKEIVIAETELRIQRNDKSINNIDAIFDEYSGKHFVDANPSQVYFKSQQNNNLHQLIDKKKELIDENEKLKRELIKYDNVVSLINNPNFYKTSSFTDKKKTLLPIFLVFVYVAFFVIRNVYKKGKMYSEEMS